MKAALLSLVVCAALACGVSPSFAADAGKSDGAAKKDAARKDVAKKDNKPINATCPIMAGEAIDPKVATTYKGKTVAFCCESCIEDFNKEPEKHMKQIAADNKKAQDAKKGAKEKDKGKDKSPEKAESAKATKAVNAMCPVHPENAVDPTVTAEYEGKLIGLCCEDCAKKFDLDPKLYASRVKK